MNHSTGGTPVVRHAACSGRAGMARPIWRTPAGNRAANSWRRRQLTAKALAATSSRAARPPRAPAQNAPTPVGRPSSGVASSATFTGCGGQALSAPSTDKIEPEM